MPDSLLLDNVDDLRQYTAGNIAGTGALSLVAIVKPSGAFSAYDWLFNWNGSIAAGLGLNGGVMTVYDGASERTGPTLVTDEWWLMSLTKATGTVTPRYHTYRYSTTTWAHGNFSGTVANFPACTAMRWSGVSGELFPGNLLIGGVWDSDLGDGIASLGLEATKGAWVTAAPDEGWRFDTTGTITPFSGVSTQNLSTGGTLDVGDAPAGWSDGPPPMQVEQYSSAMGAMKFSRRYL
jgi:hypothetical protein